MYIPNKQASNSFVCICLRGQNSVTHMYLLLISRLKTDRTHFKSIYPFYFIYVNVNLCTISEILSILKVGALVQNR